jgi:hypothetical protein
MNLNVLAFGGLFFGAGLLIIAYTLTKDPDELIAVRYSYVTAAIYRIYGKAFVFAGLIICLLSLLIP